jgi:hypothetical protein
MCLLGLLTCQNDLIKRKEIMERNANENRITILIERTRYFVAVVHFTRRKIFALLKHRLF